MFKNLALSAKIVGGFIVVLIIAAGIGFFSYYGLSNVSRQVKKATMVNQPQNLLFFFWITSITAVISSPVTGPVPGSER